MRGELWPVLPCDLQVLHGLLLIDAKWLNKGNIQQTTATRKKKKEYEADLVDRHIFHMLQHNIANRINIQPGFALPRL